MKRLTVEEAVEELKSGRMIILTDAEERENEGDLLFLADRARPEHLDLMSRHARGLICVAISEERARMLNLPLMVQQNSSLHETAFTVSVDAADGRTGISIADRLRTIQHLGSRDPKPSDLARPGHIFPLIGKKGGLRERQGHTEGALELAAMAGAEPAVVICEILGQGYHMACGRELEAFADEHGLGMLTMADIELHLMKPTAETLLSTRWGTFDLKVFPPEEPDKEPPLVLTTRGLDPSEPFLLRIHSECLTGDLFGSLHCDCGEQLDHALQKISQSGGMLIYLRQEGRGIGLSEKIRTYELQATGLDTWEANTALGHAPDERNYDHAVKILNAFGAREIRLMTNNPDKIAALEGAGFGVERIDLEIHPSEINHRYLKTKKERFHHLIMQGEY